MFRRFINSNNSNNNNNLKVFLGFSGGPWKLPNHNRWCALLPKSQATSDHRWLIFKNISSQCAFRLFLFYLHFFIIHPAPCCPEIWVVNIFQKFSPDSLEGHDNCMPNHYKWCALLPKSQATSNHGWLIFKDVSGANVPLVLAFFYIFFILHQTPCCPEIWPVKIFQKFSPCSLKALDNCQTTRSCVLSSQNHKQLQTTGGLFSKTFRANVPFVSSNINLQTDEGHIGPKRLWK